MFLFFEGFQPENVLILNKHPSYFGICLPLVNPIQKN